MFNRHPPPSARHRHRHGDRGIAERIFLARDWIHHHDDDAPSTPLGPGARGPLEWRRDEPPVQPSIDPLPPGTRRPTYSVMLPTYEPELPLERALASVLAQAPAADSMQIAVVDDGSRRVDVEAIVRRCSPPGRVEIHRHDHRIGLAGNWNRCLRLARGRLVHILHQDDSILPGFYGRIERGFLAAPDAGMAFCRSRIVDGHERLIKTSSRQQWLPGILSTWLPRIAQRQRVQTPAAVVARSVYERLGGFRSDLCHALDWEMWVRIAASYPVWYEPRVLAVYCRHGGNESSRLLDSGEVWPDLLQAIELNSRWLGGNERQRVREQSARWYAGSALRTVEKQLGRGELEAAERTLAHFPDLLRFLPGRGDSSPPLRRAGRLQDRLRTALRRAA